MKPFVKWFVNSLDHRLFIFGINLGGSKSKSRSKSEASGTKSSNDTNREVRTTEAATDVLATTNQQQTQQESTSQDIAKNIASQSDVASILQQLTNQLSTQSQQQSTSGSDQTTGRQTAETTQTSQALGTDTQNQLMELLTQLGGGAEITGDIAQTLTDRANTGEADLADNIAAIVAGARERGTEEIGRRSVAASQQAGSSMNSIVQQLGIEGAVDLETQLAELEASLGLQTRQQVTGEFSAAAGVAGGETAAATQIADVLKGAETTATGTQASNTEQLVQSLQDLVASTTGTVATETQQQEDTATTALTQEEQTMQQLTDTLSQLDQTQLTEETKTLFDNLTAILSSTERFKEKSSGSGSSREKGIGLSLSSK